MSKLKEQLKKLKNEGLLDKLYNAIEKRVRGMSDAEFNKQVAKYDKGVQKFFKKFKNDPNFFKV
tara:strand:+ start:1092 stop:1283 length:192 start_codon:yes stop_codon:yes gene_type:complete